MGQRNGRSWELAIWYPSFHWMIGDWSFYWKINLVCQLCPSLWSNCRWRNRLSYLLLSFDRPYLNCNCFLIIDNAVYYPCFCAFGVCSSKNLAISKDFTLPQIFQLDSTQSLAESRWSPGVHPPFFLWWQPSQILVQSPPGVCPESGCLQVDTSGQNGLHLRTQRTWLIQPDSRWSPARLIITSLLLLLYNTKKSVTSMNWMCNLRSTATLSTMNAQPVGPQRLTYIDIFYAIYTNWLITFLERMSANSDTQFGIINHQQPLAFNHHPWHLEPPPLHHHHPQQPLLLTATIDHLQPRHTTNNGTTNGDVATPWPENRQKQPHCSQMTASTHERTQVMMSQGETAHLPPPI